MWRGHQALQSSARRWLLRGRRRLSAADQQHVFSFARCHGGAASYAADDKLLFQKPSLLSAGVGYPSLTRYGVVGTKHNYLSSPLLISSHDFSTRRPRVPRMKDLNSVEEVIVTAYEYLDIMSRRDVGAVWARIQQLITKQQPRQQRNSSAAGELSFDDTEHMLYTIFDDTTDGVEYCGARELTETTLGMAKISDILREEGKRLGEGSSRTILRRLLLSEDMAPNYELFRFLATASMGILNEFDARSLSNLALAYAKIDYVPEFDDGSDLFDHIAMQAVNMKGDFIAQGISNTVWAFAKVNKSHDLLFEAMGDHVVAFVQLKEFKPQALKDIVWAYATAGVSHATLFEKVANHIVQSGDLDQFKPQHLSNTVWAYATAGIYHPKLFEKIAKHIVKSDSLKGFNTQNLANTVWAYATAQVSHPKLFQKVAEVAIHRNKEFISQEVANLLRAYATMGIIDKLLFSSFAPTAAILISSFANQNLANIAWAYAVADHDAPSLFNKGFINKCVEKKDGFVVENFNQLYQWHLWQTGEQSNAGLPVELLDRSREAFISQDTQSSKLQGDVVAQLSSIGLDPKEEVLMNSGYRIDAVVEVDGKTVGVEVDGPSHFIGKGRSPTGSTILKRRQVPAIDGIELVSVPYWEWDKLGKDQTKKQDYLRRLLRLKSDNE